MVNANVPQQIIVKKSNGTLATTLKILGFVFIICCLSSMWTMYSTTKAVGNAIKNVEWKAAEKQQPIIRDMSVTTRDTTDITMGAVTDGSQAVSTKSAKIGVYNNCDCESDEVRVVTMNAGSPMDAQGEIDIQADDKWKCVNGYNIEIFDYRHSYAGTKDGEYTEGSMNIGNPIPLSQPIKVGCEPGENFSTQSLNFKWKMRE